MPSPEHSKDLPPPGMRTSRPSSPLDSARPLSVGWNPNDSHLNFTPSLSSNPFSNILWSGSRATHGVYDGSYMFDIEVESVQDEWSGCVIGWSTCSANLQLGECDLGFGYSSLGRKINGGEEVQYGGKIVPGDVVTAFFNSSSRSISFSKNGDYYGTAFAIPPELIGRTFFPHVYLRGARVKANFGERSLTNVDGPYRYLSTAIASHVGVGPDAPVQRGSVTLTVGLPFSGKSTWIRGATKKAFDSPIVFSIDDVRSRLRILSKDERNLFPESRIKMLETAAPLALKHLIELAASKPGNYFFDDLYVTKDARAEVLKYFPSAEFQKKAVVFMPTISVLQTRSKEASEKKVVSSDGQVERNASEPKRKVEREVVKVKVSVEEFLNFQELFEIPSKDEGFDLIEFPDCPDPAMMAFRYRAAVSEIRLGIRSPPTYVPPKRKELTKLPPPQPFFYSDSSEYSRSSNNSSLSSSSSSSSPPSTLSTAASVYLSTASRGYRSRTVCTDPPSSALPLRSVRLNSSSEIRGLSMSAVSKAFEPSGRKSQSPPLLRSPVLENETIPYLGSCYPTSGTVYYSNLQPSYHFDHYNNAVDVESENVSYTHPNSVQVANAIPQSYPYYMKRPLSHTVPRITHHYSQPSSSRYTPPPSSAPYDSARQYYSAGRPVHNVTSVHSYYGYQ